ncbi:hypothetical protein D3C73_655410 [compost metagenome]
MPRLKIRRQPAPEPKRIVLRAMEIEQPFAAPHRHDQPVLALDHRFQRIAIVFEFRCPELAVRLAVLLGNESDRVLVVVCFEKQVHHGLLVCSGSLYLCITKGGGNRPDGICAVRHPWACPKDLLSFRLAAT